MFDIPQEISQVLDANPALAQAFAIEADRVAVRRRIDEMETTRYRGTRFAAWTPEPRPAVTVETILERARESVARTDEFRQSPAQAYLAALSAMQIEAEAARAAYCRAGSPLGAMPANTAICAGEALVRANKAVLSAVRALAAMQGVQLDD